MSIENGISESHYLETVEGLFFAVKGLVHPPDRYLACLRYAPDPEGERVQQDCEGSTRDDGVRRYRRLYHFAEQERLLAERYPHYLAVDPACGLTLQSVPRTHIRRIYSPARRLAGLRGQPALTTHDPVAADAVAFAAALERAALVPADVFGVSGSLLIGLHTLGSDLDLTVYGRQEGWAVQRALQRLLAAGEAEDLRRMDGPGVQALYAERVTDTHMAFADFVAAERHKVNQGVFRGRPYFIRFIAASGEVGESYGDYCYRTAGRAEILATVTDAAESLFTPCRYAVADLRFLAGLALPDLREIVSFRGRFCEQAQAGQQVRACGQVERVTARDGRVWHRLLLGNAPEDVMIGVE